VTRKRHRCDGCSIPMPNDPNDGHAWRIVLFRGHIRRHCPDCKLADDNNRWFTGYTDALLWLPDGNSEEIGEFLDHEDDIHTVFIHVGHSLAKHWGFVDLPLGETVGDVDRWDQGYGAGFYAALHDRLGIKQ
jgi:hypothetical protein